MKKKDKIRAIIFNENDPEYYAVKYWIPLDPASPDLFKIGGTAMYGDREMRIIEITEDKICLGDHPIWAIMTDETLH